MKKIIAVILTSLIFISCINNRENALIGTWREYVTGINGETKITDDGYSKFLIISKKEGGLFIIKDFNGKYAPDSCDNILFDGKELTFRKKNKAGDFNSYKLTLDNVNNILHGEEKSFNGNTYQVKYKKVNKQT